MFSRQVDWFTKRFVKRVRFWSEKEWKELTPKEKVWIWYKHHWGLVNQGSGEIDTILMFAKPENWYKIIAIAALLQSAWGVPWWVAIVIFIPFEALNYVVQWLIGEWKDKNDLIALEQERDNRRNKVFREFRGGKIKWKTK